MQWTNAILVLQAPIIAQAAIPSMAEYSGGQGAVKKTNQFLNAAPTNVRVHCLQALLICLEHWREEDVRLIGWHGGIVKRGVEFGSHSTVRS
jgi:hypothetical protein